MNHKKLFDLAKPFLETNVFGLGHIKESTILSPLTLQFLKTYEI